MSTENTAPHQTPRRARYQTPSKLVPAVLATVKLKLKEGKLKLKRYDSSMIVDKSNVCEGKGANRSADRGGSSPVFE